MQIALEESKVLYQSHKENIINNILSKDSLTNHEILFNFAFSQLNDFQKNIFYQCIDKKSAGLSLPLGSGKTLISICIGLYYTIECNSQNNNNQDDDSNLKVYNDSILVVTSKSLITNWETEIKKFFGDQLKYEIIHKSMFTKSDISLWKIKSDTKIVLITIDTLADFYKEHNIDKKFINSRFVPEYNTYINEYLEPKNPFHNHKLGGGVFYSMKWGCLIVDEVQKYTNIETLWCQCLGSICADYRWVLSGTMFDEPSLKRILGYYIIINASGKPRNLPEIQQYIKDDNFRGLNDSLIIREKNDVFIPPKVNEHIISHELSKEESIIYTMMKKILVEVKNKAEQAKLYDNIDDLKKFNSYKLVMIMYLRQSLICPLIPITSVSLNVCDVKQRSQLSEIIIEELKRNGLNNWLNDIQSVKSSRIRETVKCINSHQNEKIIVFGCFKSFLDILQYYLLELNRSLFVMTSVMNIKKRHELLKNFEQSNNGILLITYQLGAEGLNLQYASVVMLIDFWWNAAKSQQAIGRIFRYGQISREINIYFFTSNTGIEKILFGKQKAKLNILNELKTGTIKTKIPVVKMNDIIKLIELEDNRKLLKNIKYY